MDEKGATPTMKMFRAVMCVSDLFVLRERDILFITQNSGQESTDLEEILDILQLRLQ